MSRRIERVLWTFNHPDENQWEAPEKGARGRYGLARALYKLYFTSAVGLDEDTIEASAAVEFAELMLPAINVALFPTEGSTTEGSTTEGSTTESSTSGAEAGESSTAPATEVLN